MNGSYNFNKLQKQKQNLKKKTQKNKTNKTEPKKLVYFGRLYMYTYSQIEPTVKDFRTSLLARDSDHLYQVVRFARTCLIICFYIK